MGVGIEAINLYAGHCYIDVKTIFERRNLSTDRFDNLMMQSRSVAIPCEDAVTDAVNAAKPIIDKLSEQEKNQIQLVITGSESAIDVGKSISTYVHDYLNLNRNCRLFEVKQCCYSGTAALQMAVNFVVSNPNSSVKALVLTSDSLPNLKNTYAEPSTGIGSVAILISNKPKILEIDFGANGYYSYEVMDFVRPTPDIMFGDNDLSLFSYLDCLENSYKMYQNVVDDVDFINTFDFFAFHTPFAGMVKGAHRKLAKLFSKMSPSEIEQDFNNRVKPSLYYCPQVGNIAGGSLYMALCGIIDTGEINNLKRVGLFSYGSSCSSEFFSGLIFPASKSLLHEMKIDDHIKSRYKVSIDEYEKLLDLYQDWIIPKKNGEINISEFSEIFKTSLEGKNLLYLKKIENYHRKYDWS